MAEPGIAVKKPDSVKTRGCPGVTEAILFAAAETPPYGDMADQTACDCAGMTIYFIDTFQADVRLTLAQQG
jgi:hypothetical protein